MHPYFIRGLGYGPLVLSRMIKTMPYAEHDLITEQGRFSPREVICHLADWEPILLQRLQKAVQEPGWTIEVFDEGEMAVQNAYASKDIFEQLARWMADRQKTVEYVSSLTRDDLLSAATHPEFGPMTAYDIAGMITSHDMYHIEQISNYLPERTSPSV